MSRQRSGKSVTRGRFRFTSKGIGYQAPRLRIGGRAGLTTSKSGVSSSYRGRGWSWNSRRRQSLPGGILPIACAILLLLGSAIAVSAAGQNVYVPMVQRLLASTSTPGAAATCTATATIPVTVAPSATRTATATDTATLTMTPTATARPTATPTATATQTPTPRELLYVAYREVEEDNWDFDIFSVMSDGSGSTNLTSSLTWDEFAPTWSPTGDRIAFIRGIYAQSYMHELYIMNADGSGASALTSNSSMEAIPEWQPNSELLLVRIPPALYTIKPDGTGQTYLAAGEERYEWSPDGSKVLYECVSASRYREVCTINADGTGGTVLTDGTWDDSDAAWSPDGSQIVFQSHRA